MTLNELAEAFVLRWGIHVPTEKRAEFVKDLTALASRAMEEGRDMLVEAFKRMGEDVGKGGGTRP